MNATDKLTCLLSFITCPLSGEVGSKHARGKTLASGKNPNGYVTVSTTLLTINENGQPKVNTLSHS